LVLALIRGTSLSPPGPTRPFSRSSSSIPPLFDLSAHRLQGQSPK
jgi:hypothetical protein